MSPGGGLWDTASDDPDAYPSRVTGAVEFACSRCRTPLTRPVKAILALPERRQPAEEYLPTVGVGEWAIDPEPRSRGDDGEPRGSHNCVVVNLDDLLDLGSHPDHFRSSGCCRRDGLDGPNLICPTCGAEVATAVDDCWTYREARLQPQRVRAVPLPGPL